MMTVLGIILIIVSVALVVLVVLQEGKGRGLSGAISGGSSDTFLGKSKAADKQKKLAKGTIVAASMFADADSVQKIAQFVKAYISMGGHQLQLNAVNSQRLLEAFFAQL